MAMWAPLLLVAIVQTLPGSVGQAAGPSSSPVEETSLQPSASESLPASSDPPATAAPSPSAQASAAAAAAAATAGRPQAAAGPTEDPPLPRNPGLVAVICIFVSILAIGAAMILVKSCSRRGSAFQKLDEVPMEKVTEDSPFAHHSAK